MKISVAKNLTNSSQERPWIAHNKYWALNLSSPWTILPQTGHVYNNPSTQKEKYTLYFIANLLAEEHPLKKSSVEATEDVLTFHLFTPVGPAPVGEVVLWKAIKRLCAKHIFNTAAKRLTYREGITSFRICKTIAYLPFQWKDDTVHPWESSTYKPPGLNIYSNTESTPEKGIFPAALVLSL